MRCQYAFNSNYPTAFLAMMLLSQSNYFALGVCVCVYVCMCTCMCVCVCVCPHTPQAIKNIYNKSILNDQLEKKFTAIQFAM